MKQFITEDHYVDEEGNPAGGETNGTGIRIDWQDGPIRRIEEVADPDSVGGTRFRLTDEPNGAFVEGVIQAALGRLTYYQSTPFSCRENALAITKLEEALHWLEHRTDDRRDRGVEGTHEV